MVLLFSGIFFILFGYSVPVDISGEIHFANFMKMGMILIGVVMVWIYFRNKLEK